MCKKKQTENELNKLEQIHQSIINEWNKNIFIGSTATVKLGVFFLFAAFVSSIWLQLVCLVDGNGRSWKTNFHTEKVERFNLQGRLTEIANVTCDRYIRRSQFPYAFVIISTIRATIVVIAVVNMALINHEWPPKHFSNVLCEHLADFPVLVSRSIRNFVVVDYYLEKSSRWQARAMTSMRRCICSPNNLVVWK